MQPVRAPAGRLTARGVWLAGALAALATAVTLVAAGVGGQKPAAAPASDLAMIGGRPLQQASCADWLSGTADERAAVLGALKRNVGGGTPYGRGSTLSDSAAYALFNRACARPYARGFLLYELYTRSAAFQATPQRFQ